MHHQASEGADPSPNYAQDLRDQGIVLMHVLALHPTQVTIPELAREITAEADFAANDAVERAVRDLTGVGLLHCPCGLVVPTRAALRFDEIRPS